MSGARTVRPMELPSYSAGPWMPGNFRCPICGTESELVLGPTQAFCTQTDPECRVVMFNPSLPDGGLSDPQYVDLSPLEPPGE